MKKLFIAICLLSIYTVQGQVFFQKVYRTSIPGGFFSCNNVFKEANGGYIISGNNGISMDGGHAALIKIDSLGNHVWDKVYESVTGYTFTSSMIQDGDSAYIMAGSEGDKLTLIKTNSAGDIIWSTVYEDSANEINPRKIQKSIDGNFILLSSREMGGVATIQLLKFDGSGNILWGHSYLNAYCTNFIELDNGDIIIATGVGGGPQSFYPTLIKTDANGNFLWRKAYNFPDTTIGWWNPICKTSDNGLLMAPRTDSSLTGNDIDALVKLDSAGNVLWSFDYLGSGKIYAIKLLPNGGFLLCGTKQQDILMYRVDSFGNLEMSKTYGGSFHSENMIDFVMDSDNGYLIVSNRDSTIWPSTNNIHIVKADSTGYSGCNESSVSITRTAYTATSWDLGMVVDTLVLTPNSISFNITTDGSMSTICESVGIEEDSFRPLELYPNPTTGKFIVEFDGALQKTRILIFNILGEIVLREEDPGTNEIQIDISKNPSGIYFVLAICNEKIFREKIIKN